MRSVLATHMYLHSGLTFVFLLILLEFTLQSSTWLSRDLSCNLGIRLPRPPTGVLTGRSSQYSTTSSSAIIQSDNYSSSGGNGSKRSSEQPRQCTNASIRSDAWTPYSMDRKRTNDVIAELDIILTKYERGGSSDAADGVARQ